MKRVARFFAGFCILTLPVAAFAQDNDSTIVIRSVIAAFHSGGAKLLALRIHENNPLDRHILKSMLDSTTVAAKGRPLPCAWPEDNPPPGSGYDLDITSLKMAGDSAVVAVTSICDSGPSNAHAPFAIAEHFVLKKVGRAWQVARRDVRDF